MFARCSWIGTISGIIPAPCPDLIVRLTDLASDRQHQCQRMVGDFGRAVVRYVAYLDTMARRSFQIDVIDAVSIADDHLQFRQCGKYFFGKRRTLVAYRNRSPAICDQIIFRPALKSLVTESPAA